MMRLLTVLLLLLASLAWGRPARAQAGRLVKRTLPKRAATLENYRDWVTMTVAWRDVVDANIRQKLVSGLPTVIVTRAYVFPEGDDQALALAANSCRVVYDLWDEIFRIEIKRAGRTRTTVAVNIEGVLRRCGQAQRLPLSAIAALEPNRSYFVGVLVEANPLSAETLARIKRWVARPRGAQALGPGDSLFGSFVGLFITHVPAADKVVAFRSQTFVPTALPKVVEPRRDDTAPSKPSDDADHDAEGEGQRAHRTLRIALETTGPKLDEQDIYED